jgi:hypothetical protein
VLPRAPDVAQHHHPRLQALCRRSVILVRQVDQLGAINDLVRRLLRITDQRAIIETAAERTRRIVRERCPDLGLALILKPAALPP